MQGSPKQGDSAKCTSVFYKDLQKIYMKVQCQYKSELFVLPVVLGGNVTDVSDTDELPITAVPLIVEPKYVDGISGCAEVVMFVLSASVAVVPVIVVVVLGCNEMVVLVKSVIVPVSAFDVLCW